MKTITTSRKTHKPIREVAELSIASSPSGQGRGPLRDQELAKHR
jgi:hypothetical protein